MFARLINIKISKVNEKKDSNDEKVFVDSGKRITDCA